MILAKDDIEKAVSWWAGKLMDHQPHSNGDDSFTSVAVCFLADTMRQSVTLDQLNTFKAAFSATSTRAIILLHTPMTMNTGPTRRTQSVWIRIFPPP